MRVGAEKQDKMLKLYIQFRDGVPYVSRPGKGVLYINRGYDNYYTPVDTSLNHPHIILWELPEVLVKQVSKAVQDDDGVWHIPVTSGFQKGLDLF